jgi:uncharacterized protein
MAQNALATHPAELADYCCRQGIRKLAFFGSVLRQDFGPESDVDVLVEFLPGEHVSLLDMSRMERELSEMLGRRVELLTQEDLSPYFRDEVLATAEVQYEG